MKSIHGNYVLQYCSSQLAIRSSVVLILLVLANRKCIEGGTVCFHKAVLHVKAKFNRCTIKEDLNSGLGSCEHDR